DEALWAERGAMVYRTSDGRELEFDTMNLPDRRLGVGHSIYLPHARLTLRARAQFNFTITDASGLEKEFAPIRGGKPGTFRLVSIKNRLGEQQRLTYDDRGQLEAVYDPASRTLRFTYNNQGKLTQL